MNYELIGPFPSSVKPVRDGIYKVKTGPKTFPRGNNFARWNGKHGWDLCGSTIAETARERGGHYQGESSMYSRNAQWWGITKEGSSV